MEPITRDEMYLATAAGEYSGELPEPVTRSEYYWQKIAQRIDAGGSVSPESINAAIEDYLNSHDADIVTEAELTDALESKADSADIPDVSGFIGVDVNNLTNYYDKDTIDAALNEKQDTLAAGDNISIETVNGELIISAANTTYSDATQQTHGLMSTADKTKLDGITAAKIQAWDNAEQNVNADWNANSGDAQILNKPDLTVYALADDVTTALGGKVDKETGRSLMSADEHTKLTGVEAGAQVNVQSDWEQNNSNADDFIKNKPANLVQDASYVHTDNNFTNAEKAKADGAIQSTEKGTAGGVAELDEYGHVPVSQLPSFVSDVIEGYYDSETTYKFYADAQHQTEIQGQSNKIYVDVNTNLSYRWSGSVFAEVSPSLALGSTDSTAYRGDWGTADHAAIGVLASLNTSEKSSLVAAINELQSGSVSVDPDRGLSENDFTDSLKSKLDGIESGAEVNVQSDWNQTVTTADDFIKNKPENLVQDASYVHTDNNYTTGEKTKLAGISAGAQVNVKPNWNAASGSAAEILNKPTIPNYSNATTSAAGLMSATDKGKLDNINAGYKFKIWEGSQNLVANSDLSTGYALTNFSALEIRYAMFYNHSANYIKTIRITRKDTELSFGDVIPAEKYEYSSSTLSLSICGLTISGSHIYLTYPEGASSFWVFGVYGYK